MTRTSVFAFVAGLTALVAVAASPIMSATGNAAEAAADGDTDAADSDTDQDGITAFVFGNTMWTVLHEVGHLLIDQLSIPVLGREEDAVDNFATILFLEAKTPGAYDALIDAADGWMMMGDMAAEFDEDIPFWDEHGIDEQRGLQMVCLMFGAAKETFADLADDYDLPEDRRQSCLRDYEQAREGWWRVLEPHRPKKGQAAAEVRVSLGQAAPAHARFRALLAERNALGRIAETLKAMIRLPHPVTLKAQECESPDAYYDPEQRSVTLCYGLMGEFDQLIRRDLEAE